jgi:hypothetical protein
MISIASLDPYLFAGFAPSSAHLANNGLAVVAQQAQSAFGPRTGRFSGPGISCACSYRSDRH